MKFVLHSRGHLAFILISEFIILAAQKKEAEQDEE